MMYIFCDRTEYPKPHGVLG